ncbi:MAG: chemotaxis protein CheD [Candidatus Heimdallarchaeota archaeon]|nr:chemotaxis protein CheD [Candidatus Heimdallarchaeota archaeon]
MVERKAGIGEIVYGKPPDILSALALGSCIGVVIYDPLIKVASLGHVSLPLIDEAMRNAPRRLEETPGRYADVAVPIMIEKLKEMGAVKLKAKLAGGAQVFNIKIDKSLPYLGERNYQEVKRQLEIHRIKVVAEDVLGRWSRTVKFYPETSIYQLRKVKLRDHTRQEYHIAKAFI